MTTEHMGESPRAISGGPSAVNGRGLNTPTPVDRSIVVSARFTILILLARL